MKNNQSELSIEATVTAVRGVAENKYAVTSPTVFPKEIDKGDSITFSLKTAWQDEQFEPKVGQVVDLYDLRLYQHGWRAMTVQAVDIRN